MCMPRRIHLFPPRRRKIASLVRGRSKGILTPIVSLGGRVVAALQPAASTSFAIYGERAGMKSVRGDGSGWRVVVTAIVGCHALAVTMPGIFVRKYTAGTNSALQFTGL